MCLTGKLTEWESLGKYPYISSYGARRTLNLDWGDIQPCLIWDSTSPRSQCVDRGFILYNGSESLGDKFFVVLDEQ